MLRNGNFMEGWETLDPLPEANFLRNQRPRGWQMVWLAPGTPLYDDPNSQATGIPECVHKLSTQLPPHEQLGETNALILDGDTTYKIFSANASFGATLSQTVTGLQPGSQATLTVPIQVHLHGETDAHGAESGVWVNGEGGWVNGGTMGDRKWHKHVVRFDVPPSGTAEIVIRVKSKWAKPKDFFFDGIKLTAEIVDKPPPDDPPPPGEQTIIIQLPPGLQISEGVSSQAGIVEINVPEGVTIQIV
jgi:hypothetical protein